MAPPGPPRDWRFWIYAAVCASSVLYMTIANAKGYIPFVASATRTSQGTIGHFHK